MKNNLRNKAVAINDIAGRKITISEAKEAFENGFAEGLSIDLKPYVLSEKQLQEVKDIAKNKYESDDWNFLR